MFKSKRGTPTLGTSETKKKFSARVFFSTRAFAQTKRLPAKDSPFVAPSAFHRSCLQLSRRCVKILLPKKINIGGEAQLFLR